MRLPVVPVCLALNLCLVSAAMPVLAANEPAVTKQEPKAIPLSGKVAETMDGGGYTYVLLKSAQDKVWVAIPLTKLTVGQELSLLPGYEIKNFTSKGLNRKFDRVIFSAGIANREVKLSPAAVKMAHEQAQMPGASAPGTAPKAPAAQPAPAAKSANVAAKAERKGPISIEQVPKAKGKNSYTIEQIYARKDKLEKKPVVVRGKVVKVSARILKRNWVHIQDGSGSEARKNNNLIVTTKDLPKVGDVVTVRGTLYNNQDFGSGYRYGVLVEGATVKK